tara:strand:- start:2991 stop:3287 length:297 start_codon:yes stop_codon:yes gene_type:complete
MSNAKGGVVKLSEIKTNNERRHRKELHAEMKRIADLVHENDAIGYTVVMFNRGGGAAAYWNTSELGIASNLRSDLSKKVLDRVEAQADLGDMIDDLFE